MRGQQHRGGRSHDSDQMESWPRTGSQPCGPRNADRGDRRQRVNHDVDHADKRPDNNLNGHCKPLSFVRPPNRMISRNSTLRCPAWTMYSTAEETSPDNACPGTL